MSCKCALFLPLASLVAACGPERVHLLALSSGPPVSAVVSGPLLCAARAAASDGNRSVAEGCAASRPRPVMGYVGFALGDGDGGAVLRAGDDLETELALLRLFEPLAPAPVLEHARARAGALAAEENRGRSAACASPSARGRAAATARGARAAVAEPSRPCAAATAANPIRPATDALPVYSPDELDDGGCFVAEQGSNNCYNYGTDIVTNTFAQPGVGSDDGAAAGARDGGAGGGTGADGGAGAWWARGGFDRAAAAAPPLAADGVAPLACPPWCGGANNCSALSAAAARDGLARRGGALPAGAPVRGGHHLALFVWPDSNFHWIRQDADVDAATGLQLWSHKPGGSPATNVDNSGEAITDPRASDFSPWTEFCGFFSAKPSELTIA